MQLYLTPWQFIGLMEYLSELVENNQHPHHQHTDHKHMIVYQKLLLAWDEPWLNLSAKLIDMAKQNPQSYSEWMIDQEVILNDLNHHDIDSILEAIKQMVHGLSMRLMESDDPEIVQDLSFERDTLQDLIITIKQTVSTLS
ncbi:MAG: hypothetical protein AAF403_05225 [Pseudomonadota bacterium]